MPVETEGLNFQHMRKLFYFSIRNLAFSWMVVSLAI